MTINFLKVITTYITNWPAKLACLILGVSFTFSCKNPQKIGLERQLSENPAGVFYTDTFTVFTETIQLEAPSTLNKEHLIVGKFMDNELGEITNVGYTKLKISGTDTVLSLSDIDSIVTTLTYDYVLGDISKSQTFEIHPLTEDFESSDSTRFSSVPTDPSSLANVVLKYNDAQSSSFKITDKGLGGMIDFFKKMQDKDFSKEFKGFALVPTESSFAIGLRTTEFGFTIKIYGYKGKDTITNKKSYTLFMETNHSKTPVRFTQISVADSNVNIFNPSNPVAYLNDMMGIHTRISVPGINSFLNKIKGKYMVTEASFIIPSYTSYAYTTQPNRVNPAICMYETRNGERYISGKGYKQVQKEFTPGAPFLNTGFDVDSNGRDSYYNPVYFTNNFPFTLNLRNMEAGKLLNNPLIIGEKSYYYYLNYLYPTQTPLTYSFLKGTIPGRKIQFVVYYNQIGE